MEEKIPYKLFQKMLNTSEDVVQSVILIIGMGGVGKITFIIVYMQYCGFNYQKKTKPFSTPSQVQGFREDADFTPKLQTRYKDPFIPVYVMLSLGVMNIEGDIQNLDVRDFGEFNGFYRKFFLYWYSKVLIEHGDRVLSLAKSAFKGARIGAKIPGIHWWYKTKSHAAELTAGIFNTSELDGYAEILSMIKYHDATLNFTCLELRTVDQNREYPEAQSDPKELAWTVLNAAWLRNLRVAGENALPRYSRKGYNKILANGKYPTDPFGVNHLVSFTYLRLSATLLEEQNLRLFKLFVQKMQQLPSEIPLSGVWGGWIYACLKTLG